MRILDALFSPDGANEFLTRSWPYRHEHVYVHGLEKHFDDKDVFVVGLSGTKTFVVAPNEDVVFPMSNGGPAHVPRGDLTRYCNADYDFAMPEGAARCDVMPGSVLYIPRGYWHMTAGATDLSWSLSLALHRPTWLEIVEREIRKRLVHAPSRRRRAAR